MDIRKRYLMALILKIAMKYYLMVLLVLWGGASANAKSNDTVDKEARTQYVIYNNDSVSFTCYHTSNVVPLSEWYTFRLENDRYQSDITLTNSGETYVLESIELKENLNKTNTTHCSEVPYSVTIFLRDTIGCVYSDIRPTGKSIYSCGAKCFGFDYSVHDYFGQDAQMSKSGKEKCYFDKTFDFILNEGQPYGEWRRFKGISIKSSERKNHKPDYIFDNIILNLQSESQVGGKTVKYSLFESQVVFKFNPDSISTFIFELETSSIPYVKSIIHKTPKGKIEHNFTSNGKIEVVGIQYGEGYEILHYDNVSGVLTKKQIYDNTEPNSYIEVIYNTDKEYETVFM